MKEYALIKTPIIQIREATYPPYTTIRCPFHDPMEICDKLVSKFKRSILSRDSIDITTFGATLENTGASLITILWLLVIVCVFL